MFQPNSKWEAENTSLSLYAAVVNTQGVSNDTIIIKVRNNSDQDFYFKGGDWIGSLGEVELMEESEIRYTDFATATADKLVEINKILVQQSPALICIEPDHWQHDTSPAGDNTRRWQHYPAANAATIGVKPDHRLIGPHVDLSVEATSPVSIGSEPGRWAPPATHPVVLQQQKPKLVQTKFAELKEEWVDETSRSFYQQLTQMTFDMLTEEETAQAKQMLWEERDAFA